jgi:tetratricopeptide (TPR) repeat protein
MDDESPLYSYAARYFQEHVAAILSPPQDLIDLLIGFLHGTEFVTWSENVSEMIKQAGFGSQVKVLKRLSTWAKFLPEPIKSRIPLDDFFERPHSQLSEIFRDQFEDPLLQYLPVVRIGDYYNAAGQSAEAWQKAYDSKELVVSRTSDLLGNEDPLVLRFRTSFVQEFFWKKRFSEAVQQLIPLVDSLRRIIGTEKPDLYVGLWLLGGAYFCLLQFEESANAHQEALRGLESVSGAKNRMYLVVSLYSGHRLEQIFLWQEALLLYANIVDTLSPVVGDINSFVLMARTAMGAIQRKQKLYADAEENLWQGWGGRKQLFSMNVNVTLDAAVQLALLFRDKGDGRACLEILDQISDSLVLEQDFERYCQVVHIRALVWLDNGEYDRAKFALLDLINQATGQHRDKNNRSLLWPRLDLADQMRDHGDVDGASMLFSDLVQQRNGEMSVLRDEPEPPRQLQVAEDALRLMRQARLAESEDLLQSNNLRWVREADFWLLGQGGPITDTAVIAPIPRQEQQ